MKSYPQILLTILAAALGSGLVVAALLIGAYYYVAPGLPRRPSCATSRFRCRCRSIAATAGSSTNSASRSGPGRLRHIPPLLIKAVLAAEDEHFFEHPGIDWRGVVRGAIE